VSYCVVLCCVVICSVVICSVVICSVSVSVRWVSLWCALGVALRCVALGVTG